MKTKDFGTILLGVDDTPAAGSASRTVAGLARATGSSVLVIHVRTARETSAAKTQSAQELVELVVAELRHEGIEATGKVLDPVEGGIAGAIESVAAHHSVGLVAVGSRGLPDLLSAIENSVSHRLIAELDCPVLVVTDQADRDRPLRRVLLAVSFRPEDSRLLKLAKEVAEPAGGSVLVLHVVPPPIAADGFVYVEPPPEAERLVEGFVEGFRAAGIEAEAKVVDSGGPVASAIARVAESWDADIVICGSRHHHDLAAFFAGATEHEVIRESHRPVLVEGAR